MTTRPFLLNFVFLFFILCVFIFCIVLHIFTISTSYNFLHLCVTNKLIIHIFMIEIFYGITNILSKCNRCVCILIMYVLFSILFYILLFCFVLHSIFIIFIIAPEFEIYLYSIS